MTPTEDDGQLIFEAKRVGQRAATRVRIAAPHGSAYNGRGGVIVRREGASYIVRLDGCGPHAGVGLPFAYSELLVTR